MLISHYSLLFIFSLILTRVMMRINISALPFARSSHTRPIPSAGGVSFILCFLGMLLSSKGFPNEKEIFFYILGATLLAIVGFIDDLKGLSYKFRLFIHFICALILIFSGLTIETITGSYWISFIFTLFSIISIINATNFLDGLDGFLCGCILLTLLFNIFFIIPSSAKMLSTLSIYLTIPLCGFFVFNFPKARIFMGDVGSTFLGFTLIFFSLLIQEYYPNSDTAWIHKGFIYTLSPLNFLWFDVVFTLLRRIYKREDLTKPHRDHLFHMLNDHGFSHVKVSSIYYLSVLFCSLLVYFSHHNIILFWKCCLIYFIVQILFVFWVFSRKENHGMG